MGVTEPFLPNCDHSSLGYFTFEVLIMIRLVHEFRQANDGKAPGFRDRKNFEEVVSAFVLDITITH